MNTFSIAEFARKLKEKYPKYAGAADEKLVVAFCQKFPQYKVNYEGGVPVSVSLVAATAPATVPSTPDSSKSATVVVEATEPSVVSGKTVEASPAPVAPAATTPETPAKVKEAAAVASPEVVAPTPAAVKAEIPALPANPTSAETETPLVQVPTKADTAGVAKTTSHAPTKLIRPIPVIVSEPKETRGPRVGMIILGTLIVVVLAAFAAFQFGLIPGNFLPSSQRESSTPSAADTSGDTGGLTGEYVSGRTTYSDEFVNVESIRIKRDGKGSVLTATVYNKSKSKLNSVIVNVSCYSGSGTQVVNASFTINDLAPGARATKDMTGVLNVVPARVDITRVNQY